MKTPLDLSILRTRLNATQGARYWKSLEEIAETPDFQEFLRSEFPQGAEYWEDPAGRRRFLKLMGASLALAGVTACTRQPKETIMPYVRAPEEIVPGKPLFFATAMPLRGMAQGVLVESHMGRPTKVEGNPEHPASLGATEVLAQASVLTLYDPDRSQTITHLGEISSWGAFVGEIRGQMAAQRSIKGGGLRVLSEGVTSPTLAYQLRELLREFPESRWHQFQPACRDNVKEGARLAFGQPVETRYRFDKADVIVALDADFLSTMPGSVRYTLEFAGKRQVRDGQAEMNRLYVVESAPSITGAKADHRWPARADEIPHVASVLAAAVGVGQAQSAGENSKLPIDSKSLGVLAEDLKSHRGKSLVIPGDEQSTEVHVLAHAMNHALGNIGETVIYTDPVEANPVGHFESMSQLVRDMEAGKVDLLVILGGNPVYNTPVDLRFRDHLEKVKLRIRLGLFEDETSALCQWHIPEAHFLESWGDLLAFDGTASIVQPLITPLYDGKSAHELLAALAGQPDRSGYEIVREYWRNQRPREDFERFWRKSLHDGFLADSAFSQKQLSFKMSAVSSTRRTADSGPRSLEIIFRADPHIFDGAFANNGWLQELPKPLTKLTWDNAALMSPRMAERLGVVNEQVVELKYQGHTLEAPIWILPRQPDDSVTVHLGYGRSRAGHVGNGAGFNAYALRTSATPWFGAGLEIVKTAKHYPLSCTQHHQSMEGRNPVRVGGLQEYRENPNFVREMGEDSAHDLSLYPEHEYKGYAWGMVIDLNACTGCNACTIACQAENNIAVVGKEQVAVGREMHWIRVDRYFKSEGEAGLDNPETYHQPVPCMQCEDAPCEAVCPVGATSHSAEGLNDMVYNRCVGTRYCSNNCPYKVRRFNFLLYSDFATQSLKMLRNPDVSVRSRGVMEKCTYCVQRINAAKIEAEKSDRAVQDGEIVTACEAVCPARAITFGNVNDPASRVSKLKAGNLNYALLGELNTRPRTTYLAALKNPNPALRREG